MSNALNANIQVPTLAGNDFVGAELALALLEDYWRLINSKKDRASSVPTLETDRFVSVV